VAPTPGITSGDIFLALSTANADALHGSDEEWDLRALPDARLDPFFEAVVQAVDEAILNVLAVSEPMSGVDGHVVGALDRDRLVATLQAQGRWVPPPGLRESGPGR
jgi:L-aminopeptidase/D-esterase-like protein